MQESQGSYEKKAFAVSRVTICVNIVLSIFKLFSGIVANSAAMISDAVESTADIFSTLVVIIGVRMSKKEADTEHPYGHERLECVAAIILSVILFTSGLFIGVNALMSVFSGDISAIPVPGVLALIAAAVTVAVKEGMYHAIKSVAKSIDSPALLADAWHQRSDALSSIGGFAGILGARMGFPVLDRAAGIIICFFILRAAYRIFTDAIAKMSDKACDNETIEKIKAVILESESVMGVDKLNTRLFGNRIYVDVEITVDCDSSLKEAHDMAHIVHDAIEDRFPKVKHCAVHVNPSENA